MLCSDFKDKDSARTQVGYKNEKWLECVYSLRCVCRFSRFFWASSTFPSAISFSAVSACVEAHPLTSRAYLHDLHSLIANPYSLSNIKYLNNKVNSDISSMLEKSWYVTSN